MAVFHKRLGAVIGSIISAFVIKAMPVLGMRRRSPDLRVLTNNLKPTAGIPRYAAFAISPGGARQHCVNIVGFLIFGPRHAG
jgi:hypothetical protein